MVCHARTRIPTPHGPIFLHLYRNNRDHKEHLAFVVDRAQFIDRDQASPEADEGSPPTVGPHWIRSHSLDAEWRQGETETERIVRGAFVGVLGSGPGQATASRPAVSRSTDLPVSHRPTDNPRPDPPQSADYAVPLVRIHSECFTGETLGSQRCDCGEQLDEALRLLSSTPPYRGVVVYLRQEGRGIGLLSKLRAYNLQDLGHDTVTANLLLGHAADSRSYEVAAAILRDLGIPQLKLLTNNPDKVESVEKEGLRVVQRVGMVPRQWAPSSWSRKAQRRRNLAPSIRQKRALRGMKHQSELMRPHANGPTGEADEVDRPKDADAKYASGSGSGEGTEEDPDSDDEALRRRAGVGMIGGGTTRSKELDKYLRTKVQRMRGSGHRVRRQACVTASHLQDTSSPFPRKIPQGPKRKKVD